MLDVCLKQGFRLNRLLGVANLFFIALAVHSLFNETGPVNLLSAVFVGSAVVLTVFFTLINEIGLKTFKTLHKADTLVQEKLSIGLPLATIAYLTLNYALLGEIGSLFLLVFAALSAQLLGHFRLARVVSAVLIVVFLASLFVGYPKLIALHLPGLPVSSGGVQWMLQVAPFLLLMLWHHQMISSTLFSTHDKVIKLQSLAATDGLTGLINRRQFNHQLHSEISRARRHRTPLTLALFDIDDFKKINDAYGHPVGDRILKELGQLIIQNVRESDTPARYGGEEFALILPETRQVEAHELLERIRALVEKTVFCLPDNPMTATISVGIAQLDTRESNSFELVESADTALYEAKRQGKNRVVYGSIPTPKIQIGGKSASFKLQDSPI